LELQIPVSSLPYNFKLSFFLEVYDRAFEGPRYRRNFPDLCNSFPQIFSPAAGGIPRGNKIL
jgi:hypothetical protein